MLYHLAFDTRNYVQIFKRFWRERKKCKENKMLLKLNCKWGHLSNNFWISPKGDRRTIFLSREKSRREERGVSEIFCSNSTFLIWCSFMHFFCYMKDGKKSNFRRGKNPLSDSWFLDITDQKSEAIKIASAK